MYYKHSISIYTFFLDVPSVKPISGDVEPASVPGTSSTSLPRRDTSISGSEHSEDISGLGKLISFLRTFFITISLN